MGAMIVKRLLAIIPVLLLVSIAVFLLVTLIPGDAATSLAGGPDASPERIAQVRAQLGLNNPLVVQYWDWLRSALRLRFGHSLQNGDSVTTVIGRGAPITLSLALFALIFGVVCGALFGALSGLRAGRLTDRLTVVGASLGLAVPSFWLGMVLISIFALSLHWLPTGNYVALTTNPVDWFKSLILPAVSLGLLVAAVQARQLRASLVDVMNSAYIRTAWGKGAGVGRVVGKHAFKNAAMPAVTVLALQIGSLIGGSVIIEQIFNLPGLGTIMLQAVLNFDLPVIQGVVLFFALIQIVLMLLIDITYGILNPKLRDA